MEDKKAVQIATLITIGIFGGSIASVYIPKMMDFGFIIGIISILLYAFIIFLVLYSQIRKLD